MTLFFYNRQKEKITVAEEGAKEGGQALIYFPTSHPDIVIKKYKKCFLN